MRQLTVTLRHPRTEELESKTFDVPSEDLNLFRLEDYAELMATYVKDACRDVASRHFDLADFPGDSAYLNALDHLQDTYKIESVRLDGEVRRYLVDTQYPPHLDNEPFSTYVDATDETEAMFLAAWEQGICDGGGGESTDNHMEFRELTDYMSEVLIISSNLVSINDQLAIGEIADRGRRLLAAVATGEGVEEALAETKEVMDAFTLLQAMNQLVEAVESGEHVETVAEMVRETFIDLKLLEPPAPEPVAAKI